MSDTTKRPLSLVNQLLNGRSLRQSLKAPELQMQLFNLVRELNATPVRSEEFNQKMIEVRELKAKVEAAKKEDDFIIEQVFKSLSV